MNLVLPLKTLLGNAIARGKNHDLHTFTIDILPHLYKELCREMDATAVEIIHSAKVTSNRNLLSDVRIHALDLDGTIRSITIYDINTWGCQFENNLL